MFKKENRLVSGTSFNNSSQINVSQFVLREKSNGMTINRFGIVVSRKIDKRAVARNRIKRLIKTIISGLEKRMNMGHDALLIAKKGIENKTKEENISAVENAFIKTGIIFK